MRPSVAVRVLEAIGGTLAQVVAGVGLAAVGFGGAVYQLEHATAAAPVAKAIFYPCLGVGVLGVLILPTILPVVQKVVVFIVPYLPLIGGRRAGDPPAPPSPPDKAA